MRGRRRKSSQLWRFYRSRGQSRPTRIFLSPNQFRFRACTMLKEAISIKLCINLSSGATKTTKSIAWSRTWQRDRLRSLKPKRNSLAIHRSPRAIPLAKGSVGESQFHLMSTLERGHSKLKSCALKQLTWVCLFASDKSTEDDFTHCKPEWSRNSGNNNIINDRKSDKIVHI